MPGKNHKFRSHCPINYGLECFGDKWALLILRDIVFRGKKTYGEFLKGEEGMATNILASRLELLISSGIIEKNRSPEDARSEIYQLTEKGLDLIPVLFEITLWSSKHDEKSEAKRIPKLIELIEKNNRQISRVVREKVKAGLGIVFDYVTKSK